MAEALQIWQQFYEFFTDATILIPIGQLVVYMVLLSVVLLFGAARLGLLVSLVFAFYWLFVAKQEVFMAAPSALYLYVGAAVLFVFCAVLGFVRGKKR